MDARGDRARSREIAADVNHRTENIGARRLHTVLERLLDDLLYNAPDIGAQTIPITPAYVRERLAALVADEDLDALHPVSVEHERALGRLAGLALALLLDRVGLAI